MTDIDLTQGVLCDLTEIVRAISALPAEAEITKYAIAGMRAEELLAPVLDYEASARGVGWDWSTVNPGFIARNRSTGISMLLPTWQSACERDGLIVQFANVTKCLAVNPLLGLALYEWGERVDTNFLGPMIWADYRDDERRMEFLQHLQHTISANPVLQANLERAVEREAKLNQR